MSQDVEVFLDSSQAFHNTNYNVVRFKPKKSCPKLGSAMGKYFAKLESSLTRLASIAAFINAVIPSEDLSLFGVSSKYFFFPKSLVLAILRSTNYTISEIQNTIKTGKMMLKI